MQITVRDEDFCVGVINALDDGGNGIVQLCADQVAALTGENFKSAALLGARQHGVLDTGQFYCLIQLLEVVAVLIDGEIIVL